MLALFLSELLLEGKTFLASPHRSLALGLADDISLEFEHAGDRVQVRIGKTRPRRTLLDLRKELVPKPILSIEVSRHELASTIVGAADTFLAKLERVRPDLVLNDPFWAGIRKKTEEMKAWIDAQARRG